MRTGPDQTRDPPPASLPGSEQFQRRQERSSPGGKQRFSGLSRARGRAVPSRARRPGLARHLFNLPAGTGERRGLAAAVVSNQGSPLLLVFYWGLFNTPRPDPGRGKGINGRRRRCQPGWPRRELPEGPLPGSGARRSGASLGATPPAIFVRISPSWQRGRGAAADRAPVLACFIIPYPVGHYFFFFPSFFTLFPTPRASPPAARHRLSLSAGGFFHPLFNS